MRRPLPLAAEPAAPTLAVWEFAGLLTTYWCNARCAFCYVHSGPDRAGHLPVARAVDLWRQLDEHAAAHGRTMRIHLGGGEPFGDWPRLAHTLHAACAAGLTPVESVETNAFWATHDGLTRARLELLAALGVGRLVISSDVFHQEFIPFDRVQRCVTLARQILGPGCVRVRWWDFLASPTIIARRPLAEREAAYAAALARHKDRLTGRAAARLAHLLPRFPAAHFQHERCAREVLASRHVHIDAAGHVFPGTCAGIILARAVDRSIDDVWRDLAVHWPDHPIVAAVVRGGSYALLDLARQHGYTEHPDGYAGKCHLCTDVRQYLFTRNLYPAHLGPRDCHA
jgi:hypothetical protein